MSPTIDLDEKVKTKLEVYKEESGSKTYSDTINLLLHSVYLLQIFQDMVLEKLERPFGGISIANPKMSKEISEKPERKPLDVDFGLDKIK